jgi:hypothetical protein
MALSSAMSIIVVVDKLPDMNQTDVSCLFGELDHGNLYLAATRTTRSFRQCVGTQQALCKYFAL